MRFLQGKAAFACVLLPALAARNAGANDRKASATENSASFRADYGSSDYHVVDFRGKFQLDETFDAQLGLQHERALGTGAAGAAKAMIGALVTETLHPRVAFLYQLEPNDINGFGFDAGLDWTANPRDEAEHETVLSLDFSSVTFHQVGVNPEANHRLGHRFLQREWLFRWSQEVNDSFSTLVLAGIDSYASAEGNLVNTATDFRRRFLAAGNGTIAGFPHYFLGVGAAFKLSEDWRLDLDYAHAEIFNVATSADSFAGAIGLQVDTDWWLGAHGGYFTQDRLTAVLAAGLSLTYEF